MIKDGKYIDSRKIKKGVEKPAPKEAPKSTKKDGDK
jgi:hypothetical protein